MFSKKNKDCIDTGLCYYFKYIMMNDTSLDLSGDRRIKVKELVNTYIVPLWFDYIDMSNASVEHKSIISIIKKGYDPQDKYHSCIMGSRYHFIHPTEPGYLNERKTIIDLVINKLKRKIKVNYFTIPCIYPFLFS